MPWQVLLAIISVAWVWGWHELAGVVALSWGGLTRIGEVLEATRAELIMPRDFGSSFNYMLLQIKEPKTRFRAARHQVARLDQPQLMQVVEMAFLRPPQNKKLWQHSPQTLRNHFKKILVALSLDSLATGGGKGLDLGSLRAGGATWLLTESEDGEMVRRRGRWVSSKIMEIYIQEISSIQFIHKLSQASKQKVLAGMEVFPSLLALLRGWWEAAVPAQTWHVLLGAQAAQKQMGQERAGCDFNRPKMAMFLPLTPGV